MASAGSVVYIIRPRTHEPEKAVLSKSKPIVPAASSVHTPTPAKDSPRQNALKHDALPQRGPPAQLPHSPARPPAVPYRRAALSALRHPNFRWFWFGQLLSLTGTWMASTAQGWLVLELTDSEFLLGLVTAIGTLPALLFTLYAGVIADRRDKRRIIITAQIAAMLLALALAVLTDTGRVTIAWILLLAFGLGVTNAFEIPTRQSFFVELVGKEDLTNRDRAELRRFQPNTHHWARGRGGADRHRRNRGRVLRELGVLPGGDRRVAADPPPPLPPPTSARFGTRESPRGIRMDPGKPGGGDAGGDHRGGLDLWSTVRHAAPGLRARCAGGGGAGAGMAALRVRGGGACRWDRARDDRRPRETRTTAAGIFRFLLSAARRLCAFALISTFARPARGRRFRADPEQRDHQRAAAVAGAGPAARAG